MIIIP